MTTQLVPSTWCSREPYFQWKERAALVALAAPNMVWRYRDFGCLEADLPGTDRDISVHVWHPDLAPHQLWTGMIHDHGYDLQSTVLAGSIVHIEYIPIESCEGSCRKVLVGRSMEGPLPRGPMLSPGQYDLHTVVPIELSAGSFYCFPKGSFHETKALGLGVTMMRRVKKQAGHDLTVLLPNGSVFSRNPVLSTPHHSRYVAMAIAALESEPWKEK